MITPAELESFDDEDRLEFENLPEKYKLHARKDLCGFLIMDMLSPAQRISPRHTSAGQVEILESNRARFHKAYD